MFDWKKWNNCWSWILLFFLCLCICAYLGGPSLGFVNVFVFSVTFYEINLSKESQTNQLVTHLLLALLIDWEFSVCVCTCLFFLCICLCICPFCLCISLWDQTNQLVMYLSPAPLIDQEFSFYVLFVLLCLYFLSLSLYLSF